MKELISAHSFAAGSFGQIPSGQQYLVDFTASAVNDGTNNTGCQWTLETFSRMHSDPLNVQRLAASGAITAVSHLVHGLINTPYLYRAARYCDSVHYGAS